jgi:peptide-methionine (R)-S-oxide reductase
MNSDSTSQARASGRAVSAAGYDVTPLGQDEVNELATPLTPEERRVLLYQGTEAPFCGNLLDNKKQGTYVCRLCALPLFRSASKFESGTGWPSFYEPYDPDHVANIVDRSHGMVRTEIRCKRCGGHLGHVFPDGPPPTGERYCLNSASMEFVEQGQPLPRRTASDKDRPQD